MASRSAKKKASNAKPPAANALAGTSNYVAKEAGFKKGGLVGKSHMPMQGMASMKRLDRPGRKRGGSIGADTSPMTTAAKLSSGSEGEGP